MASSNNEARDRKVAQALLDQHGGDRRAVALQLLGGEQWSQQRAARAVGRSPSWVRKVVHGRKDPPRATVHCECGWTGKRAGKPLATPCPECDRGTKGLRLGVRQATGGRVRLNVYLPHDVHAKLGPHPSTNAAQVLTRWAHRGRP